MKLNRVTITGADDSITPKDIINLNDQYPFCEWGILFSKNRMSPRFASLMWLNTLKSISSDRRINLSAHLCGEWVTDLLNGDFSFYKDQKSICSMFNRIQINTHGLQHNIFNEDKFIKALTMFPNVQYIFQMDGVNNHLFDIVKKHGINAVPLFDLSSGAGILPVKWPKPIEKVYCGYAGGLSPENLSIQLDLIEKEVGDRTIWIDVETKIRQSGNDRQFDIQKVNQFLKICQTFINKNNQLSKDSKESIEFFLEKEKKIDERSK